MNINSNTDQKVIKLEIETKMTENNKTIYDLDDYSLQEVIKKLSVKEIFTIERIGKRFQFCVKEVLKQKVIHRMDF